MVELADTLALGASAERRAGSSPVPRTIYLGMGYVCLLGFENILEWKFEFSSVVKWAVVLAVIVSEF
jgi:hypothetical protein